MREKHKKRILSDDTAPLEPHLAEAPGRRSNRSSMITAVVSPKNLSKAKAHSQTKIKRNRTDPTWYRKLNQTKNQELYKMINEREIS